MFETLRKTLAGLTAAAALTAIAAPAAMAQEKSLLDDILARGKLIVGTGSTNAPWHFRTSRATSSASTSTSRG
jgi:polar amino acid transport system substrate-binding protein